MTEEDRKIEQKSYEPAELTDREIYETEIGPVCMSRTEQQMYEKELENRMIQ